MRDFIENPNFPYSESQKKYLRLLAEDKDLIWIERKSCLCNGTKTSKILDRDRYGIKIPIMLCEDCGLIYCAKVMEKKSKISSPNCITENKAKTWIYVTYINNIKFV